MPVPIEYYKLNVRSFPLQSVRTPFFPAYPTEQSAMPHYYLAIAFSQILNLFYILHSFAFLYWSEKNKNEVIEILMETNNLQVQLQYILKDVFFRAPFNYLDVSNVEHSYILRIFN